MSALVSTLLSLHSHLETPMTKSSVLAVCKVIELLKCVQYTFHRRAMLVAEYSTLIVSHYELGLLSYLESAAVSLLPYSRKIRRSKIFADLSVTAKVMLAKFCHIHAFVQTSLRAGKILPHPRLRAGMLYESQNAP